MNYLVFNERGELVQSNKVYDHSGYGDLLSEHNMQYVAVNSDVALRLDDWWVSNNQLTGRPEMPYNLPRSSFKADGKDGVVLSGLPKPCRVTVTVTGGIKLVEQEECTEGVVEVSSPVPATYTILIEAWPHKPRVFTVEGL